MAFSPFASICPVKPEDSAKEMVQGFPWTLRGVKLLGSEKVVVRSDYLSEVKEGNKVALICGGGSGHEPAHAGFVGKGMLTAAVAGNVFASPSTDSVLAAISTVTGLAGCLVIVKNYTGDRLNFGLAVERARSDFGLKVEMVVVEDDVALKRSSMGRRGLAGTILVEKIAGAAAEFGYSLEEVKRISERCITHMATMGVSFAPVLIPGGKLTLELVNRLGEGKNQKIELGMGIHGESGAQQISIFRYLETEEEKGEDFIQKENSMLQISTWKHLNPSKLTEDVLSWIFMDSEEYGYLSHRKKGESAALLINSLGSTTPMELSYIARAAVEQIEANYSLKVTRLVCGTVMTSLNMPGFSISVLLLDKESQFFLDLPSFVSSLPPVVVIDTSESEKIEFDNKIVEVVENMDTSLPDVQIRREILEEICTVLLLEEDEITRLDRICGDGDCGLSVKAAAKNILSALKEETLLLATPSWTILPPEGFSKLGKLINSAAAGSLGVLYNILFQSLSANMIDRRSLFPQEDDLHIFAHACLSAVHRLSAIGGAKPGDRTMIDVLQPTVEAFLEEVEKGIAFTEAIKKVSKITEMAMHQTEHMQASAGRSSYVPAEKLCGIPDPGAYVTNAWLQVIAKNRT